MNNNTSKIIRKFNRFELKYVLRANAANRFKEELAAYLHPDQHGDSGHYMVASLYYDSPAYHCYWEKIEGIKFRRKLRIRHYETKEELTPDTPVFVEIKQRLDRVTQKRRALLSYQEALNLCNKREIPASRAQDRPVIEEILSMLWRRNLQPASLVSYLRQAYVGSDYDIGLRVTFDTNLRYRNQKTFHHGHHLGHKIIPTDMIVMEVKVNERVPYWLTELVGKHNFRLVRISKYCQSLEVADRVPHTQRPMYIRA